MRVLILTVALCNGILASAAQAIDHDKFITQHCVMCHGPDLQEGDVRLDTLKSPTADPERAEQWELISKLVASGDMPPASETRPPKQDAKQFVDWIGRELARTIVRVPALRRLNRVEYQYSVQDLLKIDASLAEYLPEDSSVQGFDNVATGLGLSAILMQKYLEAANTAVDDVIRRIEPLPPETRRAVLMESKENIGSVKGNKGGVIERDGAFIDFTPGWPPARIDDAHPIEDGLYRCRVAVFPHEPNDHRTLTVACFTGPLFGDGKRHLQGVYDVVGTPENPRIIEFETHLSEGNTIHVLPWIYPNHVTWRDKNDEERPGVGILWAETYGPLDQKFPSESQIELFGNPDSISMDPAHPIYMRHRKGVKEHDVISETPYEDTERIIRDFAPKAFRRPVDKALVDQFVRLAKSRLDAGANFEQAVRTGVAAILCSPHFLLINAENEVDDYALASRLSYFLWCSVPDQELLDLAAAGRLSEPQVLHQQVDRMIDDPKIERFIDNFTGQWLDLRDIEFTKPDAVLYPEYEDLLLYSMLKETKGFFRHVLKEDLSVSNFIDSDFAYINQRLATHYDIPGIRGHEEFRLVDLPENSVRGGLLTQASVLKVTANGTTTSPVIRGLWVLENLLGQPSLPPPAGVPAVEPDIRGATTIREQLSKHRDIESCARCHRRIDPPGFALEEFDVIGGLRDNYRSVEKVGRQSKVEKTNYYIGPEVEKGDALPDGTEFDNFTEFREIILGRTDEVAHCLAEKLLIYGCGRPVNVSDREVVTRVVEETRDDDFGLRSIIHAVVDSELFQSP